MLSLSVSQELKEAGLAWHPAELDYFAIPLPGLNDQVFVIGNMTIMAEPLQGQMAITFHGSVEWALDHVWLADVVWLPREDQLREMLEERLRGELQPTLKLMTTSDGYRCELRYQGRQLAFEGFGASQTYAAALLHLLRRQAVGA